ncbi:MAG: TRAP transporter large permease subunit, partial [Rhodospirillaceae bacterium]
MAEDTKPTPSSEIDDPQVEKGESQAFIRPDTGLLGSVLFVLGIIVSLGHVYLNTWGTLAELRFAALHFAGFGLICALAYPMVHAPVGTPKYRLILGVDIVLGLLVIACALYLIGFEDALYKRGQNFSTADWIFSGLAVLLAMEFTRRTTGWLIPAMIIISLSYVVWWGALVDGVFHFPGLTAETVLYRSFFVTDGMFGPIARISYSYVAMFILFGAFLLRSGAGDFIIDLAKCAAGKIAGGPGIVAVLGSGLMGSISGSAVANTVSTGVIT